MFYALKRMNFPWKRNNFVIEKEIENKGYNIISFPSKFYQKKMEVKALYLLINKVLKIIKTVFMPGQKKGIKFMVIKRKNEVKEKI